MFKLKHSLCGGSSDPKPAGPSKEELAAQRRSDMAGYWDNYAKWMRDAEGTRVKSTAKAKAEMSARGMREGSDAWNLELSKIQGDYDARIGDIRGGEHHRQLSEYYGEQGQKSGLGMMDWYKREFGEGGPDEEAQVVEAGGDSARAAAAKSRAKQAASGLSKADEKAKQPGSWW